MLVNHCGLISIDGQTYRITETLHFCCDQIKQDYLDDKIDVIMVIGIKYAAFGVELDTGKQFDNCKYCNGKIAWQELEKKRIEIVDVD